MAHSKIGARPARITSAELGSYQLFHESPEQQRADGGTAAQVPEDSWVRLTPAESREGIDYFPSGRPGARIGVRKRFGRGVRSGLPPLRYFEFSLLRVRRHSQPFSPQDRSSGIFITILLILFEFFVPQVRSAEIFITILLIFICPAGPLGGNFHDDVITFRGQKRASRSFHDQKHDNKFKTIQVACHIHDAALRAMSHVKIMAQRSASCRTLQSWRGAPRHVACRG